MSREQQPQNPAGLPEPVMPISALCLPEHLSDRAEVLLGFIQQREAARRDYTLTRALAFAEGLEVAKAITRAEREALQRTYCAVDRLTWADPNEHPQLMEPHVAVEGDALVIRITTDALLHAVTMSDHWPVGSQGQLLATITDRPLFLQEIVNELLRDNEQGATPVHLLFEQAAGDAMNAGSQAVEYLTERYDE